ncbi:hypothetical protein CQW23_29660 [Capsicum baccatum]|uniref:Fringe-related protein n=1 Tax=Capsicum baccatum TaxID=33114 RepID=A0A2G2VCM3_CAPBA|nr:hypothetical protein CQW23_29660 [Capsicum baccatum]
MIRVIEETFAEDHGPRVRWYVMTDDDTVLLIDNLVSVLSKYDHTKYYYAGMNSECVVSNFGNSFQMAFGGAGYALSYPLAQAVAKNMDTCIKSYPNVYGSDHMLQACIADLGVTITLEKGFHQIDLHNDISGFLSAHPQSPFLSIHHLDAVDPIFPSMNRFEALNHLMKAANVDQSRLLQQSTCYNKKHNWTFSVSWGYSVQIYDKIHAQSYIAMPIETFGEWRKGAWPPYMFNVRGLKSNNGNSCGEVPNVLFFDSLEGTSMNHVVTTYVMKTPRSCGSSGNDDHSIDGILKIHVFSPIHKLHVGITYLDKATQTENIEEDTLEKILNTLTTLSMKVDSMGTEIEKLKTNEDKLKSITTNQLTQQCAELCRSEDNKIPELEGDVGTLHKTHNIYQSISVGETNEARSRGGD